MLTNIDIDEDLIAQAMQASGARTKREVVDRALRELVARSKRTRFRDIWGTGSPDDLWPDYDPKAAAGEPPGLHRVEQGVAMYKVAPASPRKSARKAGKR